LDCDALIHAWPLILAEGKDKPPAVAVGVEAKTTVRHDMDLERDRLAFEKEKFGRELELKRLRLDRKKNLIWNDYNWKEVKGWRRRLYSVGRSWKGKGRGQGGAR
jgi:hypothetical protein